MVVGFLYWAMIEKPTNLNYDVITLNYDQVKVKVYFSRRQNSHMQRQWARLARRGWYYFYS